MKSLLNVLSYVGRYAVSLFLKRLVQTLNSSTWFKGSLHL